MARRAAARRSPCRLERPLIAPAGRPTGAAREPGFSPRARRAATRAARGRLREAGATRQRSAPPRRRATMDARPRDEGAPRPPTKGRGRRQPRGTEGGEVVPDRMARCRVGAAARRRRRVASAWPGPRPPRGLEHVPHRASASANPGANGFGAAAARAAARAGRAPPRRAASAASNAARPGRVDGDRGALVLELISSPTIATLDRGPAAIGSTRRAVERRDGDDTEPAAGPGPGSQVGRRAAVPAGSSLNVTLGAERPRRASGAA